MCLSIPRKNFRTKRLAEKPREKCRATELRGKIKVFSANVQRTLCLPLRVKSLTSLLSNNQSAAAGDGSNSISDYGEVSGGLLALSIGELIQSLAECPVACTIKRAKSDVIGLVLFELLLAFER